jgi:hypothetical protein
VTSETLIRGSLDTLEVDSAQVPKRVVCVGAEFLVSSDGTVKLIDPPDRRLIRTLWNGHPVVSFAGQNYFVAELVARAFLDSKVGMILFSDGDSENVAADNLIIDMSDVEFDRWQALMRPDHLPFRPKRIPPRGMSMSRQQRIFMC